MQSVIQQTLSIDNVVVNHIGETSHGINIYVSAEENNYVYAVQGGVLLFTLLIEVDAAQNFGFVDAVRLIKK
jgi:hypothetical protein